MILIVDLYPTSNLPFEPLEVFEYYLDYKELLSAVNIRCPNSTPNNPSTSPSASAPSPQSTPSLIQPAQ